MGSSPTSTTTPSDEADAHLTGAVEAEGLACLVVPTVMHELSLARALAAAILA